MIEIPVVEVVGLPAGVTVLDPEQTVWAFKPGSHHKPHKVTYAAREAIKEWTLIGWRYVCDREATAILFGDDPLEVSLKKCLSDASKQGVPGVIVINERASIIAKYPVSLLSDL